MSDFIKHECGIAMIRLLKPLDFYIEKYGTPLYGIQKLNLLMTKQRNRGQDGAGIATIKLHPKPGMKYIDRKRVDGHGSIKKIFDEVYKNFKGVKEKKRNDSEWLKTNIPYAGELLLGHLRYGTHGKNSKKNCHPFHRRNNWINRNLVVAGNFNLTNVDELFEKLVSFGQYPNEKMDTVTVLEKIGHFLDDEVQRLFDWYRAEHDSGNEITNLICDNMNIPRLLKRATREFDGGYAMAGMIGHGDAFLLRDPSGIRPAYYYYDDEVAVVASERPAIQTTFDIHINKVQEIPRGHAFIIKRNSSVSLEPIIEQNKRKSCSFERIYFSRGTDRDIYLERKELGRNLADRVLKAVNYDFDNTVFSFVPNTAESAFLGLIKGVEAALNVKKQIEVTKLCKDGKLRSKKVEKIMSQTSRVEKIIVKDEKLRTFITADDSRGDMVAHGYDVTYGIVQNEKDTLILLDDSIVRGTTLKESIISIVARLRPKKIIIVSSAPQIRYPDCYGIDMSKMGNFVAFKALVALLKQHGKEDLLQKTYQNCIKELKKPKGKIQNRVKALYATFSYEEISNKIAEIVTPRGIKPKVEVIYQTIEGLHNACENHNGDWYFSGNYPTEGGNMVVNRAFINYMEGRNERAY
ncbi:class II glutamine amidotransferase [Saprospiraceae bacterium]|jgi:amidophosphoribosyltransferase|nr:class II glutamine amidotransferase [Bacteroidota bacterium]MDB4727516.1 class II glutamine amidotransferase [Saprospiraceae bacterium]